MKKARIILASISILAIVGGALAFKARSALYLQFCTSTTSGFCLKSFENAQIDIVNGTKFYYVLTNNPVKCKSDTQICSGDRVSIITTSATYLREEQ